MVASLLATIAVSRQGFKPSVYMYTVGCVSLSSPNVDGHIVWNGYHANRVARSSDTDNHLLLAWTATVLTSERQWVHVPGSAM